MNKRICKTKEYMRENSLDSLIVTDRKNMRYLTSYTGEGYIVLTDEDDYLVTDSRYTEQAKKQTRNLEICDIAHFKPREEFGFFEKTGFENQSIGYGKYLEFSKIFKKLVPVEKFFLEMRSVKDDAEIEKIRMAEKIGDMAFSHILSHIKPGVSERDIALEIEYYMRKNGAEALSFDTIVATGVHGAMPHAEPDERLIGKGDFVTLDFGCVYQGYCSDMTRTVCVGKATDEMKKVYNTVLKAQLTAIDMLKAGVVASSVHIKAAEITDAQYPGAFGHGLGHGVGLDIHELPNLSSKNQLCLEKNNVVTVEPGIYIPDFGGVRIEDLVVINDTGITNLTNSPKNLIEL